MDRLWVEGYMLKWAMKNGEIKTLDLKVLQRGEKMGKTSVMRSDVEFRCSDCNHNYIPPMIVRV